MEECARRWKGQWGSGGDGRGEWKGIRGLGLCVGRGGCSRGLGGRVGTQRGWGGAVAGLEGGSAATKVGRVRRAS